MKKFNFSFLCLLNGLILVAAHFKDPACCAASGLDGDGRVHCLASRPAWTYDAVTNRCHEFRFGGCGGNSNRFLTQRDCEQTCVNSRPCNYVVVSKNRNAVAVVPTEQQQALAANRQQISPFESLRFNNPWLSRLLMILLLNSR